MSQHKILISKFVRFYTAIWNNALYKANARWSQYNQRSLIVGPKLDEDEDEELTDYGKITSLSSFSSVA
jgi:hypothetical protein